MKVFIVFILLVFALLMGIWLNDTPQRLVFSRFPVEQNKSISESSGFPLYVYLFLSSSDTPAQQQIIKELSHLPAHFRVVGVVPDNQLNQISGISFPVRPLSRYQQYKPFYTPSILAVTEKGTILFLRPVVPGLTDDFRTFLLTFYQRISDFLLTEKK